MMLRFHVLILHSAPASELRTICKAAAQPSVFWLNALKLSEDMLGNFAAKQGCHFIIIEAQIVGA